MKIQTFLSNMAVALRRLLRSDSPIPAKIFWRGKYYRAYAEHTTIIHYPDGIKLEKYGQVFFISYEKYPEFRDADTATIGSFSPVGDQVIWKKLGVTIDLRWLI